MFKFEKLNPLNEVRDRVNKKVNESRLPTEDFKSTVGVYGGKLEITPDEKMIWNNQGIVSKIDKFGDAILRTYDEHLVKNMSELFKRHPKLFFKFLAPGTKRYRGSKEEIFDNIKRLGLEETYGLHEKGIEIKDKELYIKGLPLQDIYRSDLIDNEKIKGFDRFQALEKAGSYLRSIHDKAGGIGEVLASDIIFKEYENGQVSEPVLNMPDIVYNKEKNIGEKEKKATDMLDFIINMGSEEFRVSGGDKDSVKKAIKLILESYGDIDVIRLVKSYIKRGRLTLLGDKNSKTVDIPEDSFTTKNRAIFTKHNEARVVNNKDLESLLKDLSLEVCEEMINKDVNN
ncbi:MAG: hypothetical protein EOM88_04145 [Clostridia bacterium]|nr:hypothetical protein [Clostridia bacterium]